MLNGVKRGNHLLVIAGRLPSSIPQELPVCVSVSLMYRIRQTHTPLHMPAPANRDPVKGKKNTLRGVIISLIMAMC